MTEATSLPGGGTPEDWNGTDVLSLLELEQLDDGLFQNRFNQINTNHALYGGQVLAQALHAAVRTVTGRTPHSLHGYFLRPGLVERSVIYRVEPTRDGASFSTRRVTAIQRGLPIFHMEASFHRREEGLAHQLPMPADIPAPGALLNLAELAASWSDRLDATALKRLVAYQALELRLVDPERHLLEPAPSPKAAFWVRVPSAMTDDPGLQACALTYASDYWLSPATQLIHGPSPLTEDYMTASLDHAMWFHRTPRADSWHLYEVDSPWTGDGRGLARGMLFSQSGDLVASTAQEVLLRRQSPV